MGEVRFTVYSAQGEVLAAGCRVFGLSKGCLCAALRRCGSQDSGLSLSPFEHFHKALACVDE
eukprot:354988-Chlamydomonas_euryale.AAC.20